MNELQTTLDEIKLDKDTNLKPENLRQGITCLGVAGTLKEGTKQFASIDEMNQSTGNKEGDLAVVYANQERLVNGTYDTIYNGMTSKESGIYFPETVTLPAPLDTKDYGFTYEIRFHIS